ncbi:MAG: hypothetical protein J2P25_25550 [Nocardiopsaceae bacterium]|nr:hypothetical protein [Nocardiopsaceae bacterium]
MQVQFQHPYLIASRGVYNPGFGSAPADVMSKVHTLLDILAWGATSACVAGVIVVGAMMAISHHRGTGSEHAASLGRVMGACVLLGTAGPLVQFLT